MSDLNRAISLPPTHLPPPKATALSHVFIAAIACACGSDRAVEVVNMSGSPHGVVVMSLEGDMLWITDSVRAGASLCWTLPDAAHGRRAFISVGPLDADPVSAVARSHNFTTPWSDTLPLDRNWRVRIRTPSYFEASEPWARQQSAKDAEASRWYSVAMGRFLRGQSPATATQIMDMRERMLHDGPRQPGAPHYQTRADASEHRGCRKSDK